ncbi:MAG: chemotaxis protein CheD [Acidobacteriota bacterium]
MRTTISGVCEVKHVVGIAEFIVSNQPGDILITYALGSCLGITIYDPVAQVGGLLHVMLPLSSVSPEKAKEKPAMFVDTGVPLLFKESYKLGAKKERIWVAVSGGASLRKGEQDCFEIGKRNILMLRKLLWRNGVLIKAEDTGGVNSRNMSLEIGTGRVTVFSYNGEKGKEERVYECR